MAPAGPGPVSQRGDIGPGSQRGHIKDIIGDIGAGPVSHPGGHQRPSGAVRAGPALPVSEGRARGSALPQPRQQDGKGWEEMR